MVKENIIPIENKKPFETVYELKNDYEVKKSPLSSAARNKVRKMYGGNYQNWQATKDIWVPHVYGPGEEWDWLKIPCPVRTCPDAINKVCKDWTHARSSCRSSYTSYMRWSTEARIKCNYCDNPSHIRNWVFKCHRHSDYSPYDGTQFTRAILIAMKARDNISEDFGTKLLEFLEDNPY